MRVIFSVLCVALLVVSIGCNQNNKPNDNKDKKPAAGETDKGSETKTTSIDASKVRPVTLSVPNMV